MSRGGGPLELPGLYWDVEKQRYFPLASKPKTKSTDTDLGERQPPLQNGVDDGTVPSGSAASRPPMAKMLREMRRGTLSYSGLVNATQYENLYQSYGVFHVFMDVYLAKCKGPL